MLTPEQMQDLRYVLNYAQPDEEHDVIDQPEDEQQFHIVHSMRRLRKLLGDK